MTKKKALILTILAVLILSALVIFFIFFQKRDRDNEGNKIKKEDLSQAINNIDPTSSTSSTDSELKNSNNTLDDQFSGEQADKKEEKYKISSSDCENDCSSYTEEKQEYCRQVCGLAKSLQSAANCAEKSGLEKDYCLKDLAVLKLDIGLCNEITDDGIKKTCQNRLTEEMMEKQEISD